MNKIVFFKDGTIMEVQKGNRYLKKQIAVKRSFDGPVPYRFSRPFSCQDVDAFWHSMETTG